MPDVSLNHVVSAQQQRLRDRQAERIRGLAIDDELEFRGALDGKIARLRALEYLVDDRGEPEVQVRVVDRVGHQSSRLDEVAGWIGGGKSASGGESDD